MIGFIKIVLNLKNKFTQAIDLYLNYGKVNFNSLEIIMYSAQILVYLRQSVPI